MYINEGNFLLRRVDLYNFHLLSDLTLEYVLINKLDLLPMNGLHERIKFLRNRRPFNVRQPIRTCFIAHPFMD